MHYPSLKEFIKLTKHANVIPVYRQINADLETPVSAFLKLGRSEYSFLLESVEGREKVARYSFLGANPSLVFRSRGRQITISRPPGRRIRKFIAQKSPLDEIKNIMSGFKAASLPGLPRFCGGLVGYLGYDTVRFFEEIPDKNPDHLGLDDAIFILTDTILIFDHLNHTIKIAANVILPDSGRGVSSACKVGLYNEALGKIKKIEDEFRRPIRQDTIRRRPYAVQKISSNFTKKQFEGIVGRAKRYIKEGDIIQVVLSQRFKVDINRGPFEVYRALRRLNPSPYMFFLKFKGTILVGSSPEMLVRCEDNVIATRPIAGTRPRGKNEQEDARLSRELIKDKKERAEHLMLVDLGRNDLGRVALSGKVEVSEFMGIEKYSHVMHLVSEVKARLDNKRYDVYDVLRAAFPAGTVSGSPKIRAMQIIDELENTRRGPYAGCVGYFSFSHNIDTCITIRTIIVKGNKAYIQAGAGIVADSIPAKEYTETVNKAKALIEAINK